MREISLAKRECRQLDIHSPRLRNEFFYILGGHDMTATTPEWTVWTLADFPQTHSTLHRYLQALFAEAMVVKRQHTSREVLTATAPYLNTFLEEAMPHNKTISLLLHETIEDTEILGYRIPKETTLILNT